MTSPQSSRARSSDFPSPILHYLRDLHARIKKRTDGNVATYIPELGKANPDWFGICLVTADGQSYEVGDTDQSFTIQSISKPFTYGIALEDNGLAEVLKRISVEPTGDAFNSISLETGTGRPLNPMINAGAIAATGLVEGKTTRQKVVHLLDVFSRYAGRPLTVDTAVYQSESDTGHRNRAIAHMLRNFDILTEEPTAALEAYFTQCSILVTCRDLGMMAATLANGGINPVTGTRAIVGDYVENILSVVNSCGMYDASGDWMYTVGMPAKSGVAGGILAVLPGQFGIGVFSPKLDARGNSVRGIEVCRELSRTFDLHMLNAGRPNRAVIRHKSTARVVGSNRLRTDKEAALLTSHGDSIGLYDLQGDLLFGAAEAIVRDVMKTARTTELLLLNFGHVQLIDKAAAELLASTASILIKAGKKLVLTHTSHLPFFSKVVRLRVPPAILKKIQWIENDDLALEWCENELLQKHGGRRISTKRVPLNQCEFLRGLTPAQIKLFSSLVHPRTFSAGTTLIHAGDEADSLFFLLRGKTSVWITFESGSKRRMGTFSPGMAFGEMAMLDRSPRSASVIADTDVECMLLPVEAFEALASEYPDILIALLRNFSQVLVRRLRKAHSDIGTLYK